MINAADLLAYSVKTKPQHRNNVLNTWTDDIEDQNGGNLLTIDQFQTKFFWLRPKKPYYKVDVGLHANET